MGYIVWCLPAARIHKFVLVSLAAGTLEALLLLFGMVAIGSPTANLPLGAVQSMPLIGPLARKSITSVYHADRRVCGIRFQLMQMKPTPEFDSRFIHELGVFQSSGPPPLPEWIAKGTVVGFPLRSIMVAEMHYQPRWQNWASGAPPALRIISTDAKSWKWLHRSQAIAKDHMVLIVDPWRLGIDTVVCYIAVSGFWAGAVWIRRTHRRHCGRCLECGYDLTPAVVVCPECGSGAAGSGQLG